LLCAAKCSNYHKSTPQNAFNSWTKHKAIFPCWRKTIEVLPTIYTDQGCWQKLQIPSGILAAIRLRTTQGPNTFAVSIQTKHESPERRNNAEDNWHQLKMSDERTNINPVR
jgi:hypothetical protein